MDIGNILQNIDFGKTTAQYVRSLEGIINEGSDNIPVIDRALYEHLVQRPQLQDNRVYRYELVDMVNKSLEDVQLLLKLKENPDVIRIMSWNVSKWKGGKGNISFYINTVKPSILCLQDDDTADATFEGYGFIGKCHGFDNLSDNVYNSIYIRKSSGLSVDKNILNKKCGQGEYCGIFVDIKLGDKVIFSLGNVKLNSIPAYRKDNPQNVMQIMNQTNVANKIIVGDMGSYREKDYIGVPSNMLGRVSGYEVTEGDEIDTVNNLEANNWVDSFVKYFADNPIATNGKVPLNTSIEGGRTDFIFVNKTFGIPILGCYILRSPTSAHTAVIMDLYYGRN